MILPKPQGAVSWIAVNNLIGKGWMWYTESFCLSTRKFPIDGGTRSVWAENRAIFNVLHSVPCVPKPSLSPLELEEKDELCMNAPNFPISSGIK